jgi:hypothetical protein
VAANEHRWQSHVGRIEEQVGAILAPEAKGGNGAEWLEGDDQAREG